MTEQHCPICKTVMNEHEFEEFPEENNDNMHVYVKYLECPECFHEIVLENWAMEGV